MNLGNLIHALFEILPVRQDLFVERRRHALDELRQTLFLFTQVFHREIRTQTIQRHQDRIERRFTRRRFFKVAALESVEEEVFVSSLLPARRLALRLRSRASRL